MELIWQMWGAVRLFYENLTEDALYDFMHSDSKYHPMDHDSALESYTHAFFHSRTSLDKASGETTSQRAWRQHLWAHLLNKYGNREEQHLAGKVRMPRGTLPSYGLENAKKSDFINGIIDACISNGFLEKDPAEPHFLKITEKGLKFKNWDGLLIEWAKYLKPLESASIVGAMVLILREVVPHILNLLHRGQW